MSRTKWTVQRCQGQARIRAIAFVRPVCWSLMASGTPTQATLPERAQEGDPERLGLDLADVEPDHLAPAGLVDAVRDHERLRVDVAAIPDLDDLGVQPQVRVVALERPSAEHGHLLVETPAQRRHPVLGHPADAELLDQAVDLARGHAVDLRLHDDCHDRLLGSPSGLEE